MNVVKEAQNPRSMRGPRRKSIGMQKVIAAAQRKVAALFFLRAKACVVKLPIGLIRSEKFRQKLSDGPGILTHDRLQSRHCLRIGSLCVHTTQFVQVWFVSN